MKKQIFTFLIALSSYVASAIGDSCAVAIQMPINANSSINNNTLNGTKRWFKFIPLSTEIEIKLTNATPATAHVHSIILLEGLCNPKYFVIGSDSRNDTVLRIKMHDLIPGMPYFILVMREKPGCTRCGATGAMFNLNVKSLPPPIKTVSNNIVYYNGEASHIKNEVVLRINKTYLKMAAVNNTNVTSGSISTFVQDGEVIDAIINLFVPVPSDGTPPQGVTLRKVYPTLTANDTISTSRLGDQVRIPNFWETFVLKYPSTFTLSEFFVGRGLSDINGIRYAEPNFAYVPTNVPNDNFYANFQPNLHPTGAWSNANINVETAWDLEVGKPFVKVGVYDSGIDATHSDLNSGKVAGGYDYVNNAANIAANDGQGHGTSVSGIIGAYRNNANQIAGIAGGDIAAGNPGVSLYDIKVATSQGNIIVLSTIANAIWAGATSPNQGYGLHAMNISWVSDNSSATFHDNVQYAVQNGVSIVAARGNFPQKSPIDKKLYPTSYQDEMVICVGASGSDGNWKTNGNGNVSDAGDNSFESMIKNGVDVIAPGTNTVVRTTQFNSNSFIGFNGTSAAAPHVAGVAALMMSYKDSPTPTLSNLAIEDVENILQMSATDKFTSGVDDHTGYGLVNAALAMNKIKSPKYKIQHFGVGQNASQSISHNLYAPHVQVVLASGYQSLAAGIYYADIYEETITLNYNLSGASDQIITSWPRFSSSFGWSLENPQNADNWCTIVSVTNNQAILKTYTYNFLYDQNGNLIVDPWYPTQFSPKVALSIYTEDKSIPEGVKEYNNDGSQIFGVYPNPARDKVAINLSLDKSQNGQLNIFDVQGKMVDNIFNGKFSEGKTNYEIPLNKYQDGVYFVKLETENDTYVKKLIIIK